MPTEVVVPAAIGGANALFGGGGDTQAQIPEDLKQMRAQQLGLLNFFLGMGPDPRLGSTGPPVLPPGAGYQGGPQGVPTGGPGITQGGAQPTFANPGISVTGAQTGITQTGGAQTALPGPTPSPAPTGITQTGSGPRRATTAPQYGSPPPIDYSGGAATPAPAPGAGYQEVNLPFLLNILQGTGGFGTSPVGQRQFARGGVVRGPGGPREDKISARLSNGEGVLTADTVNALGGPSIVDFLNMLGMLNRPHSSAANRYQSAPSPMGPVLLGGGSPRSSFATGGTVGAPNVFPTAYPGNPGVTVPPPNAPTPTAPPPAYVPSPSGTPSIGPNYVPPATPGQERLESFFGPLGTPVTDLQRQSVGGMQQFLSSNPYSQSQNALSQILGMAPGQGIMEALQPHFERNLAAANQTGGRFGSANAIMRSRALEDYNLLGAQAAQQGQQQQLQAAEAMRMLGGQQVNDLTAGYNLGGAFGQQVNSGQQQSLQLLLNQLQTAQAATLGVPTSQQPSGWDRLLQGFGAGAQFLPYLNQGGGIPPAPNWSNPPGWNDIQ